MVVAVLAGCFWMAGGAHAGVAGLLGNGGPERVSLFVQKTFDMVRALCFVRTSEHFCSVRARVCVCVYVMCGAGRRLQVSNPAFAGIVEWNAEGDGFLVLNEHACALEVLPVVFGHRKCVYARP